MMNEKRPNVGFLGIGAQKCATTWLHDAMSDHPEIALSQSGKEVDFFSYHYDFGFQWYERQFESNPRTTVCGEISPSYFHAVEVPERVQSYNPGIRLILILREPVARAISNHNHEVRTGHLSGNDLSFEFGLRNNPSYVNQGRYGTHLARWLEHFSRDDILILPFEDIVRDPAAVMRLAFSFIGVQADHKPALLNSRSNQSYAFRNKRLDRGKNGIRRLLENLGLGQLWQTIGNSGLRSLYRQVNRVDSSTIVGRPADGTLDELRRIFRPEIERLQVLSTQSFEHWLDAGP